MMQNNKFLLSLLVCFVCLPNTFHSLTDSTPAQNSVESLLDRLGNQSRAILNEKIRSGEDLKKLQFDILKKRNFNCVSQKDLENFGKNDFDRTWQNDLVSLSDPELRKVINEKCLDSAKLEKLFSNISAGNNIGSLSELVLGQLYNKGCDLCQDEHNQTFDVKAWIFGFLAATMITFSSFSGAFLLPLTKHKYYKTILMFLISLAIGTLTGTSTIHLIPQAFGIDEDLHYAENHKYVWKSLVITGGLYLFFIIEQIMKFLMQFKKHRKFKRQISLNESKLNYDDDIQDDEETTDKEETEDSKDYIGNIVDMKIKASHSNRASISHELNRAQHGHSHHGHSHHDIAAGIAPVAWIIICSEGLHNFIDGLSIGAAFTETILKGFSISLAIICEEFPHKLGDFAILLAAGMSFKMALFCNFMSSCLIYIGVALGIVVGENLGINTWIYALAGGMFMYIAVCDMIPELNEMGEELEKSYKREKYQRVNPAIDESSMTMFSFKIKIRNILIQHSGILIGFFLMLILSLYAEKIIV